MTFSIIGGANAALFSIDANTGALSFLSGLTTRAARPARRHGEGL